MKVSTIIDYIDNGHMSLPEFQRGYVWKRPQVRALMQSLYRKYPVGGLLLWATATGATAHRGEAQLAPGVTKLILDGQQRLTSLYGVIRGRAPPFFDGDAEAFTNLRFHLENEDFEFWQPVKMRDDPLWVDVSSVFTQGMANTLASLAAEPAYLGKQSTYMERLMTLQGIRDIEFHADEVTGQDKTLDIVVDIFNRVNSGGTKLSKGDLALAKICAEDTNARASLKHNLHQWSSNGYDFTLEWLLRNVNTVATGEAKFEKMHDLSREDFVSALKRATRAIDEILNLVDGRLGLDHKRVLAGYAAIPVMAHLLVRWGGRPPAQRDEDLLLYWYLQNAMWGRYSGSVESIMDKDLKLVENLDGATERLVREVGTWRGGLRVRPENFVAYSAGSRFYALLYLLTRVRGARDLGTGNELKSSLLGKMNTLEVHHIFPKRRLYDAGYEMSDVNQVANFCFLTKLTNLNISADDPAIYLAELEKRRPGVLESQWIPMDRTLWSVDRYKDFLAERRRLLAEALNGFLDSLSHGLAVDDIAAVAEPEPVYGGGFDGDEEIVLDELNSWMAGHGLPAGEKLVELTSPDGRQLAVLDLAWPEGIQAELTQPVALALNESPELLQSAINAGYRCFMRIEDFRKYVEAEILADASEVVTG